MWNVITKPGEPPQVIPDGEAVPEGWTVEAKTANPDSLNLKPDPRTCSPLEFIERFTDEEQVAIVTAAMQVPKLRLWYDKLMAATDAVEGDPRLVAGMDALVEAGLLTPQRRDEVLTWS